MEISFLLTILSLQVFHVSILMTLHLKEFLLNLKLLQEKYYHLKLQNPAYLIQAVCGNHSHTHHYINLHFLLKIVQVQSLHLVLPYSSHLLLSLYDHFLLFLVSKLVFRSVLHLLLFLVSQFIWILMVFFILRHCNRYHYLIFGF